MWSALLALCSNFALPPLSMTALELLEALSAFSSLAAFREQMVNQDRREEQANAAVYEPADLIERHGSSREL